LQEALPPRPHERVNFNVRRKNGKYTAKIRVAADDPEAFRAAVESVPAALKASLTASSDEGGVSP
jgi:hypothetical protein